MRYVFVYGTLRQGERANYMLADCEYQGSALLKGGFNRVPEPATDDLVSVSNALLTLPGHDRFPAIAMMRADEAEERGLNIIPQAITGEVYAIPPDREEEITNRLDRYEGYPRLYGRAQNIVELEESSVPVEAWVYYMMLHPDQLEGFSVIRSGDWKDREDTISYLKYAELYEQTTARARRIFRPGLMAYRAGRGQ